MKTRLFTKAVALFLSVIMVFSVLPLSVFAAYESPSNLQYEEGIYELLGQGFNALTDNEIWDTSLEAGAGLVFDEDKVKSSLLGTSRTESFGLYEKTAKEMMFELGIDYNNKASVSLPVENAKLGLSKKFGFNFDTSATRITDSFYYYYRQEIITNKYELILTELDTPEQLISNEFDRAVKKLSTNYNDAAIADFFNTWGTHILTSYNKGGAIEHVASAHSENLKFSAALDIEKELAGKLGYGDIEAEVSNSFAAQLKAAYGKNEYHLDQKWYGYGGNSAIVGPTGVDEISNAGIINWQDSVSGSQAVLIPQSTEWIAIWELIPDSYASLKNELQEYYQKKATGINAEFFAKFTNYKEVTDSTAIYYQSPAGYTAKITYNSNGTTKVAPGSSFNVVNLDADLSNIVFPKSNQYTVDKYGVVTLEKGLAAGSKVKIIVADSTGKEITAATKTFTVEPEGTTQGLYAGGYGDEVRPYLISNATQFSNIRQNPSSCFVLTNNFALGNIAPISSFSGTFDGRGYTLSGWQYLQNSEGDFGESTSVSIGVFATNKGTIKNLKISGFRITNNNPSVTGMFNVGMLCGTNEGTISNIEANDCEINADIGDISRWLRSWLHAGIICGWNRSPGIIEKCVVQNGCNIYIVASVLAPSAWAIAGCVVGGSSGGTIRDVVAHNNTIYAQANSSRKAGFLGICADHGWSDVYIGGIIGFIGPEHPNDENNTISSTTILRAVAYNNDNTPYPTQVGCTCNNERRTKYVGGVIGRIYNDKYATWNSNSGYTQTNDKDKNLVGNQSATNKSTYKKDSLTAKGLINNLAGYSTDWYQAANGGHLSIAQPSQLTLDTSIMDKEYFVGETLNFAGLKLVVTKNNGTSQTYYMDADAGQNPIKNLKSSHYTLNSVGKQTVTITFSDQKDLTASFEINVVSPSLNGIVIDNNPYKLRYFKGEKINYSGLSVLANYTDGSVKEIPLEQLTLPGAIAVNQTQEVTVSYQGKTAAYTVEALDILPSKLEVIEDSYKKNFGKGEDFAPTGLQALLTYNNGSTEILDASKLTVDASEYKKDEVGSYNITVQYENVKTTYQVIIGSVKSIDIATLPNKLSYYSSDKFVDSTGLTLNVTYDNGVTKVVSSGFTVSGYDRNDIGEQELTVTYNGATATYRINVVAVQMTSLGIFLYPKTSYYVGHTLTSSGLTLEVNYNDSSSRKISSGYTVQLEGYDVGVHPTLIALGTKKVLVTYTENGILQTVEYEIEILKDSITELQVIQDPNRTTYNLWDKFNYNGMIAYAVYASGKAEQITLDESMFSVKTFEETGAQTVTLNYLGRSAQIGCMVNAPTSISITKNLSQTEYEIGETISAEGVEASILFPDGSTKFIDQPQLTFTYPSTENAGSATVWVNFGDLKTYYNVTITDPALAEDAPRIEVQSRVATKGREFTVSVEVKNNPGFAYLEISPFYSPELTLVKVENGELISDFTKGKQYVWLSDENVTEDGLLMTFTFSVDEETELGKYQVGFTLRNCANYKEEAVTLYVRTATIQITDFIYGDATGDGVVDGFDVIRLKKYLANYDYETGESTVEISVGADATGDGIVDGFDVIRLKKYLANYDYETGESTVVLGPQ